MRAEEQGLFDVGRARGTGDEIDRARRLPLHNELFGQGGIAANHGLAVYAEGFARAWNQKE